MLYLTMKGKDLIIGYIVINNRLAAKITEQKDMVGIEAFMEKYGFTEHEWRIPKFSLWQIIRVKGW